MKLEAIYNGRKFIIEEDLPEVGAYLYVFEEGDCIMDYLQNDVEACKQFASERFHLPLSEWKNIITS